MTERIQRRRGIKGAGCHGAVNVARPSKWGNPHDWRELGNAEAVRRYREDLLAGRLRVTVEDVRRELAGRSVCCYCDTNAPCHGDVLLEIAAEVRL